MPSNPPIANTILDPNLESNLKHLPQNIEAEEALLGAILTDNRCVDLLDLEIDPKHFFIPVHGRIYEAVRNIINKGQVADSITLAQYFEKDTGLVDIGGPQYLRRLQSGVTGTSNVADYAKVIRDLSLRRDLLRIGNEISNQAVDSQIHAPAEELLEKAESNLFNLAETGSMQSVGPKPFNESLISAIESAERAHKRDGNLSGLSSGLHSMDELLGGMHNSDLIVLAGRPSMGKTALATNIAFSAATALEKDKNAVAFFSLEMSDEQLANRILAEQAGVSSELIRRGKLTNEEFTKLVRVSNDLTEINLFIDDTPAINIAQIRTRARRLKRQHMVSLIVVDYLQLVQGTSKHENRVQEISEITQGLKAIAKELNVPVLALSQLSRAAELREDKRPQLADLRESGTIEQDADVVMFIFRQEYYEARAEPKSSGNESVEKFQERYSRWQENLEKSKNIADIIVAKQRHGPVGTIQIHFDARYTKFTDLADKKYTPENR